MRRVVGRAADLLLGLVAPKATASAQTNCWISSRNCITDGLREVACEITTCCTISGRNWCDTKRREVPPPPPNGPATITCDSLGC